MKKEATLELIHPIIFVEDFHNKRVVIPPYSAESTTSANSTCISIKAIADVDGEVTVVLADREERAPSSDLLEVFNGNIMTPTRKIALVTSHNEKIVEIDVPSEMTTVVVHVDDMKHPSRLLIETSSAAS